MTDLHKRKCEACAPGTLPMEEARAKLLHSELDHQWNLQGNKAIRRDLDFKNFRDAFAFATRVALLAEQEGHHPDFEIGWGRLSLTLTTHVAKGLTPNDFILAAKIDHLSPLEIRR